MTRQDDVPGARKVELSSTFPGLRHRRLTAPPAYGTAGLRQLRDSYGYVEIRLNLVVIYIS